MRPGYVTAGAGALAALAGSTGLLPSHAADVLVPLGAAYGWVPRLLGLHVGADLLIGISYLAIAIMVTVLVRRTRTAIPFRITLLLFGCLIALGGLAHLVEIWVVWTPQYWLSGALKLAAALVAVATAVAVVPQLPAMVGVAERVAERDTRIMRLLGVSGAGTWVWDLDERLLEWDPSLEPLHGFSPGEFSGGLTSALAQIHPEDRERVHREMRHAVECRGDLDTEYRVTTIDGDQRVLAMLGRLVCAADGRPLRMAGMSWDVTARHMADTQFRAVVEASPSAMIAVDDDGRIALVSAQAEALFGYPAVELVGEPIEVLVPERRRESHRGQRTAFLDNPSGGIMGAGRTVWARRCDGSEVPVEIVLTPVRREAGLHVLASITDLTEQMRRAGDVHRLNLELQDKVAALKSANGELEAFTYSVSHDLRAPLRAIDGFAAILVDDHAEALGPEGRRLLDVVCSNAEKMGDLIDDLLALSRFGRRELVATDVDVAAIACAVVEDLREASPEREVEVRVEALPSAAADAGMIRQVLANLIGNAWKFTGRTTHPVITIGAESGDDETVYFVRDNGAGFDEAYADKLFGVFQRLHTPDAFEGNGIGLVVVQRIVERHGGRVWARGTVGEGATFFFTLAPLHEWKEATPHVA